MLVQDLVLHARESSQRRPRSHNPVGGEGIAGDATTLHNTANNAALVYKKEKDRKEKRENAAQLLERVTIPSRHTDSLRVHLGCRLDSLDCTLVLALGENDANANRAALVADHKPAKRRERLVRLDTDGSRKG